MDVYRPVLLLIVPADWEEVPEGVRGLHRCLGAEYGASLLLRQASRPLSSPITHFCGVWDRDTQRFAKRDVTPRVDAAFYSLDWLELGDVG